METTVTPIAPLRPPRVTLWLLRAVLTVQLVAVAVQPILAGLFLTGDVDVIAAHGLVGGLLARSGSTPRAG